MLAGCGGGGTAASAPAALPKLASPVAYIVASVNGTPSIGTSGTYALTVTATSAGGATITGTYATPILLTNDDPTGATKLSVSSLPSSTTAVSIKYNGLGGSSLGGFQGTTITASSGPISTQIGFLSDRSHCVTFKNIRGLYPCDLQSAYSLPSMAAGAGQRIALVDAYDYPKAEADLAIYRSQFGLPPCTTANGCFTKVNQRGAKDPPRPDSTGWSLETALDMDMASAICPNCRILLVESDDQAFENLGAAEDTAAAMGATQISNSYGAAEYDGQQAFEAHYNHPSAMITVSTGDRDYGPQFPSTSPYVTAVGGTSLEPASNGRGWSEHVWNNANVQGTGSGCSFTEPKPAWQLDTGCPFRTVADVSADADPFTGVAFYDTYITSAGNGGWMETGGTSVAAPIIAAVYALGEAPAATLNYGSYLYSHSSALNDITTGNDGGCGTFVQYLCTAQVGYDGPTGNGSPNGVAAFGGANLITTQSVKAKTAWRTVLQPAPGTPTVRACQDSMTPGMAACFAVVVQ